MKFEVPTMVNIKIVIFCDVKLCTLTDKYDSQKSAASIFRTGGSRWMQQAHTQHYIPHISILQTPRYLTADTTLHFKLRYTPPEQYQDGA